MGAGVRTGRHTQRGRSSDRRRLVVVCVVLLLAVAWLLLVTGVVAPGRRSLSDAERQALQRAHDEEKASLDAAGGPRGPTSGS